MTQAQGFDISNLEKEVAPVTHKVSVIDDEDGNPVSGFLIVGKNSPEFQKASQAFRIQNIKRASARKNQIDATSDAGAAAVARAIDENDRTIALAVTVGWFGMISEGAPMHFNPELVAKMFDRFPTWQAKVLAELEDDANFTQG